MAVALKENALLNPADPAVAGFLRLPAGSDALVTLINRASDYCDGYCNRPLKAQGYVGLRLPSQRGPALRPLATPIDVLSPLTLALDGRALTVWRAEADGDPGTREVVVSGDAGGPPSYFYRALGWEGRLPAPIVASFTGGLDPIPEDLIQAALLVCQTLQRHEKGATEAVSYGPGPVSQGVVYRPDSLVPMWSKQVLDRYRVVPM